MTDTSKPISSPTLMTGMASTLGLDANHLSTQLGAEAFAAMSDKCQGCTKPDACILWMVDHAEGASNAPGFCLNGEALESLKRAG